MPMTFPGAKRERPRAGRSGSLHAFRQALFAQLARAPVSLASTLDVRAIEEHLAHAHRAGRRRWPTQRPEALHLCDAALATACVQDRPGAWQALAREHEHALIAAAMWVLEREDAIIAVRKLLAELRRTACEPDKRGAYGLKLYRADRPLRDWLLERLTGRIAVGALASGVKQRCRRELAPSAPQSPPDPRRSIIPR